MMRKSILLEASLLWALASSLACTLAPDVPYGRACDSDSSCGDGYRCGEAGRCVVDEGGGPEDAGRRADGGNPGVDGGSADGGAPDAAVIDAGSTDGGSADGGPAVPTPEQVAAQIADEYVRYIFDCLFIGDGYSALDRLVEPDLPPFVPPVTEQEFREFFLAGLSSPNTRIDVDSGVDCVEALIEHRTTLGCTEFWGEDLQARCENAIIGTLPAGAACQYDVECEAYCQVDENDCGTCARLAREGESCEDASCDDGLYCGQGQVCVSYLQVGDTCQEIDGTSLGVCDYVGDLLCDPATRLCALRPGVGEPCDSSSCQFDLRCDMTLADPVCVDTLPAAGSACRMDFARDCLPRDTALACVGEPLAEMGTCEPITVAEDEEECRGSPYRAEPYPVVLCLHGETTHYCADDTGRESELGTCQRRPSVGEPCAQAPCVEGAICDRSQSPPHCVDAPGEGDACIDYQCGGNLSCETNSANPDGVCQPYTPFRVPMCMAT